MRRHVFSNLDDLGLEARELAKAAARRAGMSLEDWLAAALAAQDKRESLLSRAPRQEAADHPSRMAAQPPGKDYEALMAAAAAESERLLRERQAKLPETKDIQAQDQASRTAIALESMASWIEQAEERLNETARASADHQDRMASILAQALTSLKDRLDTVENKVTSESNAPRVELPVQEALQSLEPLSKALVGLRTDVSRLSERLEHPHQAWTPAVEGIRSEIERLQSSMGGLATRGEITALSQALREVAKEVAKDLEQGHSSKDLLTLAASIAALYRQVQSLADETAEGVHRRIGGEIDLIKAKIDKVAETGVDRSVIDFLSSQIVDLRHDLAHRAEPQQIARLSEDVAALSGQIVDLRANQPGRGDFAALKSSLESVCSALNRTVAAQEASDVPEQLQSLSRRLDALASRPEPQPANLDPIAEQLALLTERMASLSDSRFDQADALSEMIERLSSQVQAVAEKEAPSQEPLMQRFDRIEQELRQFGQQANTSNVESMLRSIEEKLARAPSLESAIDALEKRIMTLADRFAEAPGEPLHKALDEATAHLKNLHSEAASIAEKAAKAALKDIQPNLPDAGDLDALKHGFFELKALQSRADKKTQETLRAVHEALETLVARFPQQSVTLPGATSQAASNLPSADRLEAAVRRLHAAALTQMEEVAAISPEPAKVSEQTADESRPSRSIAAATATEEANLGSVRANFIAAARRAAQVAEPEKAMPETMPEQEADHREEVEETASDETPLSPPSLMERLRRTFDHHRRPLLFSLALLILATGAAQILANKQGAPSLSSTEAPQVIEVQEAKAETQEPPAAATTASVPVQETSLFQASSLAAAAAPPPSPAQGKFFIDPATVGAIPAEVPAALRQAALSGDAAAIYDIASRAAEGRGLDQDMALAVRLLERAAQAGLPPAQERLAMMYDKGIGVPRDPKLAATWYERGALGGNIRAMHNLATLLASGASGKPDYATALRWYSEAAEAGLKDSQFNMGVLFARGIGTKQNSVAAYKWFSLAAAQGDMDAAKKRDEIAARLAAAELGSAKTAVEQWRARAVDPVANEIAPSTDGQTAALDRTSGNRS